MLMVGAMLPSRGGSWWAGWQNLCGTPGGQNSCVEAGELSGDVESGELAV